MVRAHRSLSRAIRGADPLTPIPEKAWTWKTMWGRDVRWITAEVKKYWPDGFPGYDHIMDRSGVECSSCTGLTV